MKIITATIVALLLTGCVSTDSVRFKTNQGQTALQREGKAAISSVAKNSIVLLSRTGREIPQGQRVGFVIAIQNRSNQPQDFQTTSIEVTQTWPDKESKQIEVLTFEKLQREERTRQVIGAILVGVAAGANSAAASRAGYYRSNSTVYTPSGRYTVQSSGYSPVAAAIAQGNANAQNASNINSVVAQGQANMAKLESEYIKDHTLLPNEWYGGVVGIEPPISGGTEEIKTYSIIMRVGTEIHKFDISQEPNKR